jgi:ABC-type uncharacterized transport system permease subunit
MYLRINFALSIANASSIALILAGILAALFFYGSNLNARLTQICIYQFSPWIVFIIFFWGVVKYNWISIHATRNNILAGLELFACIASAISAIVLFIIRYRASKIDTIA